MLTDDDRERLETVWFTPIKFNDMFPILNSVYKRFGFTDELSDEKKIAEYSDITKEYRKYISKTRTAVLSTLEHKGYEEAIDLLKNLQDTAPDKGSTREILAYNFIRDSWLSDLIIELSLNQDEQYYYEEQVNE